MATGFARKGRQRLRFLICAAWTPLVVLVLAGADPAAARTATSQISSPIATRGALSRLQVNPLLQQGPKLLGRSSEFSDAGWFGSEVALSANGSTALISGGGAIPLVWVFTRSGSIWTQRQTLCSSNGQACFGGSAALSADGGTALIDDGVEARVFTRTGSSFTEAQTLTVSSTMPSIEPSASLALSADGSTALIGDNNDNGAVGAVWVFTRTGSSFTQQQELTGGGESGGGQFGRTVALSADGNTALIAAPFDNNGVGAVWVFTRSGSSWLQQQTLTAALGSETGAGNFGASVALSADGNTTLIGGDIDNNGVGAMWVFTRSGSSFAQQQRLTAAAGTETGAGNFGGSVALSANGSTALIGGGENGGIGAVWVLGRSGSSFAQQQRLSGGGEIGEGSFGGSAALSADGGTALIGGPGDSNGRGAVWVFAQHLAKPPVTKITQVKISRQQHWAKFSFKAPGAKGFECALMKQPDKTAHFSRCKSPKTCTHVRPGTYIFEVRALSAAGAGPIVGRQFKI